MIITLKDEQDKVIAYAVCRIVDKDGKDDEFGIYAFCDEAWVHPSIQFQGTLKELIKLGLEKQPLVKWLYFRRSKHNERIKIYDARKLLNKGDNSGRLKQVGSYTTCRTNSVS